MCPASFTWQYNPQQFLLVGLTSHCTHSEQVLAIHLILSWNRWVSYTTAEQLKTLICRCPCLQSHTPQFEDQCSSGLADNQKLKPTKPGKWKANHQHCSFCIVIIRDVSFPKRVQINHQLNKQQLPALVRSQKSSVNSMLHRSFQK